MTLRPIAGLLIMTILAGCQSVDVEPAKSSLHIPAQWRATSGPASPTEQLWWRNFHDSNLNRYVDQALKNNRLPASGLTSTRPGCTPLTAACSRRLTRA